MIDTTAISLYHERQTYQEIEVNRIKVREELEKYLIDKLGETEGSKAVQWLNLHLQGYSSAAIEEILGLPVRKIYRLREKVAYHADNFATSDGNTLVENWLEISPSNNFGLTPSQWSNLQAQLTEQQRQILSLLQQGLTLQEIGEELSLKKTLLKKEWREIYTKGQKLGSQERPCG